MRKVLLMGNPNVGKSVVFSRLTGVNVISSNYPGTTVEFSKGYMRIGNEKVEVIDVPGTYSLEPTSKAEQIAIKIMQDSIASDDGIVVNIIDGTNLERNLNLTLQLLKKNIPVIVDLNFWDEAKHLGISIDGEELEKILNVPVVPTCAVTGEGIKELVDRLPEAKAMTYDYPDEEKWHEIGKIIERVQKVRHRHHTFLEKLADASIKPLTGIPIALGVVYITFKLIRFIGEGLIGYVFEPIFEKIWAPLIMKLSSILGSGGFMHDILIGRVFAGKIEFFESFGILTTGLYVPFAAVLPYVFAFYLVLSFFEDSGYLPRLGVLADKMMHQVGLHGLGIISMMLGLGCNVPGALATRIMETKRERFISATLMAIAVPCIAQIAMIVGLVSKYGAKALILVFGTLFLVWVAIGILMNHLLKGESPEIFVEIPPYRIPYFGALAKKLWMRVKRFLKEAIPFMLLGVFLVNILYSLGIIDFLSKLTGAVIKNLLGLPSGAVAALLVGFLRKDVAVGMLVPLGLTLKQLVIASVVLAMYFPCAATFAVLVKELGIKDMIKSAVIMMFSTILVGSLLNFIL
ncbi:MAG: FeoB small GTPase domain-containing protein [bacterium]